MLGKHNLGEKHNVGEAVNMLLNKVISVVYAGSVNQVLWELKGSNDELC